MNQHTQNWMLIWLFCIAVGSCTPNNINIKTETCTQESQ